MEPFDRVVDLEYIDAHTGAVIETVKMREFYEFGAYPLTPGSRNPKACGYVLVRHYQLAPEAELQKNGSALLTRG